MFNILMSLLMVTSANAAHFLGGTISWEVVETNHPMYKIAIQSRTNWKFSNAFCNETTRNNINAGDPNTWTLSNTTVVSSIPAICMEYVTDEWTSAARTFSFWYMKPSNIGNISYASGSWQNSDITTIGGKWILASDIDLETRSDTNAPNHVPMSITGAVVELTNCKRSFKIPVLDADNDTISCHYCTDPNKGGERCATISFLRLDQNTCTIYYDGSRSSITRVSGIFFAKDHPRTQITVGSQTITPHNHISATPIQFMIYVKPESTASNCMSTHPTVSSNIKKNAIICFNTTMRSTLYATSGNSGHGIQRIIVLGPLGFERGPLAYIGSNKYSMQIWWTPIANQTGQHLLCFYSNDTIGLQSEQQCRSLKVIEDWGCSDGCAFDETDRVPYCTCTNENEELANDNKTCIPKLNVDCSNSFKVKFYNPSLKGKMFAGSPLIILPSCVSKTNDSEEMISFGLDECDTIVNIEESTIDVKIFLLMNDSNSNQLITRGKWWSVDISCDFTQRTTVKKSFIPDVPRESIASKRSHLQLDIVIDLYKDEGFLQRYDPIDYPVEVKLSEDIRYAMRVVGNDNYVVNAESCIAKSRLDQSSSKYFIFPLIKNRCSIDQGTHVTSITNDSMAFYTTKAFFFTNELLERSLTHLDVHIECIVVACRKEIKSPNCQSSCDENGRTHKVKRSTNDEEDYLAQVINSGSLIVKIAKKNPDSFRVNHDENIMQPKTIGYSTIAIGCLATTTLSFAIALIVLTLKRVIKK